MDVRTREELIKEILIKVKNNEHFNPKEFVEKNSDVLTKDDLGDLVKGMEDELLIKGALLLEGGTPEKYASINLVKASITKSGLLFLESN